MKKFLCVLGLVLALPTALQANTIYFWFTGNLVVVDPSGYIVGNNGSNYTPIAANLSYTPGTGIGDSDLLITMPDFLESPAVFHDMTLTRQSGTPFIDGNVLLDWTLAGSGGATGGDNMPLHIQWDASGLLNAIDYAEQHLGGLQVGDRLSGTDLFRGETYITNISSAEPYSDSLLSGVGDPFQEYYAPLAATNDTLGITTNDYGTLGFKGYFNIGSGNTLTVVENPAAVPIPAAVWLFGFGLLGLVGIARRK